jgi:hypothetical protein
LFFPNPIAAGVSRAPRSDRRSTPEASAFRLDDFFNASEVLQKDPKPDAINFFGWTPLRSMFAAND